MKKIITADVGGTQIRVAVYPEKSTQPVAQKKIRTRDKEQTPLERLSNTIAELWPADGEVAAISIAVPGFLNPANGIVYEAANVPGWKEIQLRQPIEDRFHVPVFLGNDANLAALGEWKHGAGQGHHNVLYLTISTGIGGGVIIDDRLLTGDFGLAGEFGHVTVIPEGPMCGCGQRGHLEAVASGTAIAKYVNEKLALGVSSSLSSINNPTAVDVSQAAAQGDPLAQKALTRAGTYIGYALADFLHIFNSSIVILGGGVSSTGALIIEPIKAALPERILSPAYIRNLEITTAALKDDAGLIGALALAQQSLGH